MAKLNICDRRTLLPILIKSTCAPFLAASSTFSTARDKFVALLAPTDSCINASLNDLPDALIDDILEMFYGFCSNYYQSTPFQML